MVEDIKIAAERQVELLRCSGKILPFK